MTQSDVRMRQSAELMVLVAGSLSGFWIWNRKTVTNWINIFQCGEQKEKYQYKLTDINPDASSDHTRSTNVQSGNSLPIHFPV